jgi:hypothetical protein
MKMQKRTNLVTQFSSFLCLKEESSSLITYWKNTPELERNIKLLLKQQTISSEEDKIAQEFLQWLRKEQDSLKNRHLIAYLQESCFFATQKVHQRLRNYWDLFTWQDYFQWANLLVSSPIQLLSNYDHKFQFKLTTYARHKLEHKLIDQAYQYMGWERSSDWGLLRKLSQSRQKQYLQQIGGLKGNNLEQYLLVIKCFNLIYKSTSQEKNKSLKPPSEQHFREVSKEYNFLVTNKGKNLSSLNGKECENIILNSIKFARQYCSPSMNNQENELQNNLIFNTPLNNQEELEDRETEYSLVNQILTSAFANLENHQKILFQLWKGLQLTQIEIVQVMIVKYPNYLNQQFQVAREINLVREYLLDKLINQLFVDQQISLTKQKIRELKSPLDYWLKEHCKQLLSGKIYELYQSFTEDEKNYIKYYFIQHNWTINDQEGKNIQASIESRFKQKIVQELQLFFPDSKHINICFSELIEDWINNSAYSLIINN